MKDAMANFQSFTNHSVQGKRKSVSHGVTIDQADADTFFCRSGPLLSSFRLAHPKLMNKDHEKCCSILIFALVLCEICEELQFSSHSFS